MILKNLLGRKIRTLLTVFGIAIGVAAVIALGALGEGLSEGYGAISGGSGADLLVLQDDALDITFSGVDQSIAETLAGFSGIQDVARMIYTFAATDKVPYFIVYGYDPGSFAIEHFKIIQGTTLSDRYSRREGKPLILGRAAADSLDKEVGDTLRLYESTFRIIGIYETGEPFEDGAAVILTEDAQVISGKPRQVNALLLKLNPGADIESIQERIENRFDNLTATKSTNFKEQQDTIQYIAAFTWGVSVIAILLGAVGIMNTMLMSVFERTHEFGVFRAVGWRSSRVLVLVLTESLVVCLIGSGAGFLIGYGVIRAAQNVPTFGALIPNSISPTLIFQALFIAVGLGVVGGGLPAWRASRLTPAEAMSAEGGTVYSNRHVRSSALRNVMRQPVRTLLTISGIAIAMMAMIMLGAMGEGLINSIQGFAGKGAQLVGSETDASVDLSKIPVEDVRRIATLPGVANAEGFLTGYASLGNLPFFIVFGYQPRGLSIRDFTIIKGEPLSTNRQIILGKVAAENLDKSVGQTLRIFNMAFKIVGIYETGVAFKDGGGVVALRDAQKLYGQVGMVSFLSVWIEEGSDVDQIERAIETRFPEISLSRASQFAEQLSDMEFLRAGTWAIAFIALVLGGLGMMNTMVMSVFERTREIGVLRALGWKKRHVLSMILSESIVLSMLGGVSGVFIGVSLGILLNTNPVIQGFLHMTYKPELFLQTFVTVVVLGVIGGAYPAWRASMLLPVEALRYE
jgi:ABC-type antimicrobial peptide transport system permease subunit